MLSPNIETERLLLRRYSEADLDAFCDMIGDERMQTFITFPPFSRAQEAEYIKECIANADTDRCEKWSLVLKSTGETVGNIAVCKVREADRYCEVGYAVRTAFWGNGYAAEALTAVSGHLLSTGYRLVECVCDEDNRRSYRVMEKAGFHRDACLPARRLHKDGKASGLLVYSKSTAPEGLTDIKIVPVKQNTELARALLDFAQNCSFTEVRAHIAAMLRDWSFTDWERPFAALCGERIVGMAFLLKSDYYPLPEIFPWVTCIFVCEEYRGRRISGLLIDEANACARSLGFTKTYIPTEFTGLYEKYGYRCVRDIVNYGGGTDRLYVKDL